MDVVKGGRSTRGRSEAISTSPDRTKLALTGAVNRQYYHNYHHEQQQQQQQQPQHVQHPKNRPVKMFNKVQVVYYLTRNGQLEHPHYIEVSHLATQPLRLRDVIERLTVLRGKSMPCQYSWSCKRSYKTGYVWNDLTENDAIYASDASEYVLKGSELIQDRDFSELTSEELQNNGRQQRKSGRAKSDNSGSMTSVAHQRQVCRQVANHGEGRGDENCQQNGNMDEYEEEEDVKRVSCNSSNATYTHTRADDSQLMLQIEQEDCYSLPSTSSNNSDKLPPPVPSVEKSTAGAPPPKQTKPTTPSESRRFEDDIVIEEDGDPHSTALTRNTALLQLIACGGVSMGTKAKAKANMKGNKNFNFNNMRNTFIPCLKHQLSSTRGVSMLSNPIHKEIRVGDNQTCHCKAADDDHVVSKEVEDEDMIMVRYMSENPRFGNLQSEEKEYFSGTIVETMTHHHTHSSGSVSGLAHHQGHPHPPLFTKSSSYNEQRSAKGGLQTTPASKEPEEDEDAEVKVNGFIKLCIPRKRSCLSTSTKSNKL